MKKAITISSLALLLAGLFAFWHHADRPDARFRRQVKDSVEISFAVQPDGPESRQALKSVRSPEEIENLIGRIRFGKEIPMIEMPLSRSIRFALSGGNSATIWIDPGRVRYQCADYSCPEETYGLLLSYFGD